MFNPLLHKERLAAVVSSPAATPRRSASPHRRQKASRARSHSPGRGPPPPLSLVICPAYMEHPEGMREYTASPTPQPTATVRRWGFPRSPHALSRTRGSELATYSLPGSPMVSRLAAPPLGRELSLPASPQLPRIQIQDFGDNFSEVEI